MHKIKRSFRRRRHGSQSTGSGAPSDVAARESSSSTSPPTTAGKQGTDSSKSIPHSSLGGRVDTSPHSSASADAAAATAAQAATRFAEDVADRNIEADRRSPPHRYENGLSVDEQRKQRLLAKPHSTDEISTGLENLTFGEPDFALEDLAPSASGGIPAQVISRDVDTTVHQRMAPAVTHETIIPVVHEDRQILITRDIHNHDIYHRVQPVIDREVLPTKHYLQNERGDLVEIPADKVPPDSTVAASWQTAQWEMQTATLAPGAAAAHGSAMPSHSAPKQRKYPAVGKFAKKQQQQYLSPDSSERFEHRLYHNRASLPDGDQFPRTYGHSPPKGKSVTIDERHRPARPDKSDLSTIGPLERSRDRGRRPPSLRSVTPSMASSNGSIRSRGSSLHVRELSEI